MDEKVELTSACEPSNILWENLSFSKRRVFLRKMMVVIVASFILYLTLIGFTVTKAKVTGGYLGHVDKN